MPRRDQPHIERRLDQIVDVIREGYARIYMGDYVKPNMRRRAPPLPPCGHATGKGRGNGDVRHWPLTRAWAEYVGSFKSSDVPAPVRVRALQMILDGSGALLAAANPKISTGRLIADFVGDLGGKAEASIVGHGFKTSVVNAALANGTMGYTCDVEPHHPEGVLHPIAVMTPTALAISEKTGASGADFVAAVILGCEIEYRLSMALGPVEQYNLGFHPSAVCGCFGATAAAAFLLGLDENQVTKAFGLAGCQASGLMAWESDETENSRPFQMGMAARNGVTSAMLAKRGFGGPIDIFDQATPCSAPSVANRRRST